MAKSDYESNKFPQKSGQKHKSREDAMELNNSSFTPSECQRLGCRAKSIKDGVCYVDKNCTRKVHCKFLKKYNKSLQSDCCPVLLPGKKINAHN